MDDYMNEANFPSSAFGFAKMSVTPAMNEEQINDLIKKLEEESKGYKTDQQDTIDIDNQISIALMTALVKHIVSNAEKHISGTMDFIDDNNVSRLAYTLLPQMKLAYEIEKKKNFLEKLQANPEIKRCVTNLVQTQEMIMQNAQPQVMSYLQAISGQNQNLNRAMQETMQPSGSMPLGFGMGMGLMGGRKRRKSRKPKSRKLSTKPRKNRATVIGF